VRMGKPARFDEDTDPEQIARELQKAVEEL
jgi:hypothetical protein